MRLPAILCVLLLSMLAGCAQPEADLPDEPVADETPEVAMEPVSGTVTASGSYQELCTPVISFYGSSSPASDALSFTIPDGAESVQVTATWSMSNPTEESIAIVLASTSDEGAEFRADGTSPFTMDVPVHRLGNLTDGHQAWVEPPEGCPNGMARANHYEDLQVDFEISFS